MRSKFPNNAF